jgi:predicted DNA-binding protein (MmcQ/YjbR family)
MDLEVIREYCLSFPGAREKVQWEDHLLFTVGGKMFLIYNLNMGYANRMSLKCTPDKFQEMVEVENIVPAPYLARNNWVSIKDGCRIRIKELKGLIKGSYELVFAKLPVKVKKEIGAKYSKRDI